MSQIDVVTTQKDKRKSHDLIKDLAAVFDMQGKFDIPIRVNLTRSYLMSIGFKPSPRGGDLFYGRHKLICKLPTKKGEK